MNSNPAPRASARLAALALLALPVRAASGAGAPAEAPDVAYAIELVALEPEPRARVTLDVPAAGSGETLISLRRDPSDEARDGADFADLAARGEDGRALVLEALGPERWKVRSAPGERLEVSWTLRDLGRDDGDDQRECYRPLLTPRFLHLIGKDGLLAPEHVAGDAPIAIELAWRGFAERGWNVACSFGDERLGVRVVRPLDEFRNALFVATPRPILRREVAGNRLSLALLGDDWRVDLEEFADLCAKIVRTERDFFGDHATPHYLVSAVPTGKPAENARSLGGTGLEDSFALFFKRGSDLGRGSPMRAQVERVLAHEMFHEWCGGSTPLGERERLSYWFSEGFTDFFTRRLLLRIGLIDVAGYAESLERSAREYLANPHVSAPNALVDERFWTDRDAGQLPYRRGDLVAALVDREVRVRTKGGRNLDDFVRQAVELGRKGERATTEVLVARIARWTDAAFAERIRAIVEDGAPIELPADLFAPCLVVTIVEEPGLELGFDLDASIANGKLTGVRAGSAAEAAGVRDGQGLASISYDRRVDRPVRLEVVVDGNRKAIEFLPHGPKRPVPAVEVVPGAGCDAL